MKEEEGGRQGWTTKNQGESEGQIATLNERDKGMKLGFSERREYKFGR